MKAVTVPSQATLPQLCSFASWLKKHTALVNSITCKAPAPRNGKVHGLNFESHVFTARHILQQAITLAVQPRAAGAANAADAAAAAAARQQNMARALQLQQPPGQQGLQQQQQQQRGLSLTRLSSDFLGTPAVVAALPAHSLIFLELNVSRTWSQIDGPSMSAALAQLSQLQKLHLLGSGTLNEACLPGIAHLRHLTELGLGCRLSGMQQLLAQPLPLLALELSLFGSNEINVAFNMSQLTQLVRLVMRQPLNGCSQLPQQLQRLSRNPVNVSTSTCHRAASAAEPVFSGQLRGYSRTAESGAAACSAAAVPAV
jgi:hypothetical protein